MNNQLINTNGTIEQRESLKLTRNTRGCSWEIRILSLDVDRIQTLDQEMEKRFGRPEE